MVGNLRLLEEFLMDDISFAVFAESFLLSNTCWKSTGNINLKRLGKKRKKARDLLAKLFLGE